MEIGKRIRCMVLELIIILRITISTLEGSRKEKRLEEDFISTLTLKTFIWVKFSKVNSMEKASSTREKQTLGN